MGGELERRRERPVVDAALGVVAPDADEEVAVLAGGELDELDGGAGRGGLVDIEDHPAADVEVGMGVGQPGAGLAKWDARAAAGRPWVTGVEALPAAVVDG